MTAIVPRPEGPPLPVRHLRTSIDAPFDTVNGFLGDPANMALWAAGLASGLHPVGGHAWQAETPYGPLRIEFTPPNPYGVIDHALLPEGAPPMFNALRVIPNGTGCEITFALFRREGMSDAEYQADAEAVTADLATLKGLLEAQGRTERP